MSDNTLQKIGRLHNKSQALASVKLARTQFDNVSADLIVGLENEEGKELCRYASKLLELGVKHISCYLLEVYENTKLQSMVTSGIYHPLSDEGTVSSFNKLARYLQDKEFVRYEISNFALPTYESKHNLNYWLRGEYLGFGLSAHSFWNGKRTKNADTVSDYEFGKVEVEEISTKEEIEEKIMLGLRCNFGFSISDILAQGYDILKNPYFEDYKKQGIITMEKDQIFLNPLFYHMSNTIISNLLP